MSYSMAAVQRVRMRVDPVQSVKVSSRLIAEAQRVAEKQGLSAQEVAERALRVFIACERAWREVDGPDAG